MRIGLLGFGTVGSATYSMLRRNSPRIQSQVETEFEITKIAVKSLGKSRQAPQELFTDSVDAVLATKPDILVETMGGLEPAGSAVKAALNAGVSVVTANKHLLASRGWELMSLAKARNASLEFEAAVAGGIPVIRTLRNQLCANNFETISGILNGTTNFILTEVEEGKTYEDALREAQIRGYAEQDPSSDVDGYDAQYKLAILCTLAFNQEVRPEHVLRRGIRGARLEPRAGYKLKLMARAVKAADGQIVASVLPEYVPLADALASVSGVQNAVVLEGDYVGRVMLVGPGAGGKATASSVVGDIIETARKLLRNGDRAPTDLT